MSCCNPLSGSGAPTRAPRPFEQPWYVDILTSTLYNWSGSAWAAISGSGGGSGDFLQAGVGAVSQTTQNKLRDSYLSLKDFAGVDATGVADSTVGIKAALDYAIPLGLPVRLKGKFRITGPLQPYSTVRTTNAALHLIIEGTATITVDPAATGFSDVLCFQSTAENNASIVGGTLVIQGSDKAARGITIRHDAVTSGGDVLITAKLKLFNFLETVTTATRENSALQVYGLYKTVRIDSPHVESVNRTNPATVTNAGACSGVAVANCSGVIEINHPWVERVLCGPGVLEDGDGVKVFGANPSVATETYVGNVTIRGGYIVNCQGRSMKLRGDSVTVIKPKVKRTSAVVTIPQGLDIDVQACVNATVIEPEFEYTGTANVAPFASGNSFSCVAFQQTVTDRPSNARCIGGSIVSDVPFPRFGLVTAAAASKNSVAEFSGCKAIATGSLTGTMVTRSWVEFDAALINSKAAQTKIIANRNEAPMASANVIGYVGLGSTISISQLSWEACDNRSVLNGTYGRVFHNLSGSAIRAVGNFCIRGNHRFRSLATFTAFDFNQAAPGSNFIVDLAATLTITNAPPWGTTGYALVEVLDNWDSGTLTCVRVTVNFGEKGSEHFYTYNSGGTWHSRALPTRTTAQITSVTDAINTNNKLQGLQVWNSTTGRTYTASGSGASQSWAASDSSGNLFPV